MLLKESTNCLLGNSQKMLSLKVCSISCTPCLNVCNSFLCFSGWYSRTSARVMCFVVASIKMSFPIVVRNCSVVCSSVLKQGSIVGNPIKAFILLIMVHKDGPTLCRCHFNGREPCRLFSYGHRGGKGLKRRWHNRFPNPGVWIWSGRHCSVERLY